MDKIQSFDAFKKKIQEIDESNNMEDDGKKQHHTFFRNLKSIKHYIDEILGMDRAEIEVMLGQYDWAQDNISTAKDDIAEVAEWIRDGIDVTGEIPIDGGGDLIDPQNIEIDAEVPVKEEPEEPEEEGEDDEPEEEDEPEEDIEGDKGVINGEDEDDEDDEKSL
jgi:hypothetical protein